jgi:hypothetical protein
MFEAEDADVPDFNTQTAKNAPPLRMDLFLNKYSLNHSVARVIICLPLILTFFNAFNWLLV